MYMVVNDVFKKERDYLKLRYPNATKTLIKNVLRFSKEKNVRICRRNNRRLDGILKSLLRHRYTPYEMLLKKGVNRKSARFITESYIHKMVKAIKGK